MFKFVFLFLLIFCFQNESYAFETFLAKETFHFSKRKSCNNLKRELINEYFNHNDIAHITGKCERKKNNRITLNFSVLLVTENSDVFKSNYKNKKFHHRKVYIEKVTELIYASEIQAYKHKYQSLYGNLKRTQLSTIDEYFSLIQNTDDKFLGEKIHFYDFIFEIVGSQQYDYMKENIFPRADYYLAFDHLNVKTKNGKKANFLTGYIRSCKNDRC